MSVASATADKPLYQQAGESSILKVNWKSVGLPAHDTINTDTGHYLLHTKTLTPGPDQVANINSNNPTPTGNLRPRERRHVKVRSEKKSAPRLDWLKCNLSAVLSAGMTERGTERKKEDDV